MVSAMKPTYKMLQKLIRHIAGMAMVYLRSFRL